MRSDVAADSDLFLLVDLAGGLADVLDRVDQPVDVEVAQVELRMRGRGKRACGGESEDFHFG